ncbi:MAG: CRISPR-associated helicase Cas3' [Smithellaceae bacterium]|nr:CRISPR-associated helicase Cas3' [Smithellaceae bacterium]
MEYIAHSENNLNECHSLSKHLNETATLAKSFAFNESYEAIFYLTGLLHDLGKYQIPFQNYLKNGGVRGSVPHASWGSGYARCKGMLETSIVIDGHHKGIPDNSAWKGDTEPFKRNEVDGFENVLGSFVEDNGFHEGILKKDIMSEIPKTPSQREVFIRYLFSALTDSDWLSTEKHFDKDTSAMRGCAQLAIDDMTNKLEKAFSGKSKDGDINRMRNEARQQVLQKAGLSCGFYSLALPTGMGKTLTSMAWALKHAKMNHLKRIIIVLPFVNIIDQTAEVLKDIFGEEWILEHHSGFNEDEAGAEDNEERYSLLEQRKKLACENWNYPVILTTTVQFFESLFSNRPSRCRKIHNIAESVVIFDEVQTLPKEIILPTLQMLKDVQRVMRTSFLFCTATQPAFERRKGFDGIDAIYPLIDNPAEIYKETRRVKYSLLNNLEPINSSDLLRAVVHEATSTLVIFNTKKAALEFYESVKNSAQWENKYHLSTSMCPAHRKNIIKNVRADLKAGRKIIVSSTQLIEAGVDFDFPVVFRAMAPLESIIQSAGRCNRENKLGMSGGRVFLFKIVDGGMPDKTYAACASHAEEFLRTDIEQLHNHQSFNKYYAQVVQLYVDPDKYNINETRKAFNFKTVNDGYRIIRDATEGLYMYNYSNESRQLLHTLEYKEFLSKDDYRKMQPFIVPVYKYFIIQNGSMCKTMPQGFMVWYGNYDQQTGISVAPIDADKLIV